MSYRQKIKRAARNKALDDAAEAARTCGNGQQELWSPWEEGFLFARKDIAKAILELKDKPARARHNPTS